MNLALFYDTETTGFPLWHEPSSDPRQPHLVQLAAALVDLDRASSALGAPEVIQSIDLIIRPDGWDIPAEASDVHGITTEHALAVGVPEQIALTALLGLWSIGDGGEPHRRIAHNESFDARMIRIAIKRFIDDQMADTWKAANAECTMRLCTPICNLPPTPKMVKAGRNHPKSPTLSEAYQHFFGRELVGAHSALVDVKACIEIYTEIRAASLPPELAVGDCAETPL